MPRPDIAQALVPSVLDRLVDLEPKISTEPPASRSRSLVQVKEAVKRDLEWLLNSKRSPEPPRGMPHLEGSLLTFGLPDFSTSSLSSSRDQDLLQRAVEASIRRFEPRLERVAVTRIEGGPWDRSIGFRIDALLRVDPSPEPVTFDSVLELSSKAFIVRGDDA